MGNVHYQICRVGERVQFAEVVNGFEIPRKGDVISIRDGKHASLYEVVFAEINVSVRTPQEMNMLIRESSHKHKIYLCQQTACKVYVKPFDSAVIIKEEVQHDQLRTRLAIRR